MASHQQIESSADRFQTDFIVFWVTAFGRSDWKMLRNREMVSYKEKEESVIADSSSHMYIINLVGSQIKNKI